MEKNIKVRYKPRKFVAILTCLIFLFLLITIILFFNSNWYTLKNNGYSNQEIKLINTKVNDDDKKKIFDIKDKGTFLRVIRSKGITYQKIHDYINYAKNTDDITLLPNIADIITEKYYISRNFERYINYYYKNTSKTSRNVIEDVNCNLDNEYYSIEYDADLSKNEQLLVNKYYKLSKEYVPNDLITINQKYGYQRKVSKIVYDAFIEMYNDIQKENLKIFIASPYRSYEYQNNIYNNYVKNDGKKEADTYSARPGFSEHQTGLAIDISSKTNVYTKFKNTDEYEWMIKNCYKYGFILRYPEGKEKQTGYTFESWHYRYVGKKVAEYIYKNKITFDEYYEYFLK